MVSKLHLCIIWFQLEEACKIIKKTQINIWNNRSEEMNPDPAARVSEATRNVKGNEKLNETDL